MTGNNLQGFQAQSRNMTRMTSGQKRGLATELKSFLTHMEVAERSPYYIADANLKIGRFVKYLAVRGVTDPAKVTEDDALDFLVEIKKPREDGHRNKPSTIRDYYKINKRFFNWLMEKRKTKRNPFAGIPVPDVPDTIIQPFSADQFKAMLLVCDDKKFIGARNKAILWMLIDTGLRLRELSDIKLVDVDLENECVKVMGKGARERIVRIGKRCQQALLNYVDFRDDDLPQLWLTEERTPLDRHSIYTAIRTLGKRVGIEGVRCSPHTLRHTCAEWSLDNGADITDVKTMFGHKHLSTTMIYLKARDARKAMERHKGTKDRPGFSPADNLK